MNFKYGFLQVCQVLLDLPFYYKALFFITQNAKKNFSLTLLFVFQVSEVEERFAGKINDLIQENAELR